jgi:hypothetical protein
VDIELENRRLFHAIVENEAVNKVVYGSVTFSINVQNGHPLLHTLRVDRMKRRKYGLKKSLDKTKMR